MLKKPPPSVTLSSAEAEALITRVHRSNLAPADAGVVEQVFRLYLWVAVAIQKTTFNMKQLRSLLFGPGRTPKEPPESEASASSSDRQGQGEGGGGPAPVDEAAFDSEAAVGEADPRPSESPLKAKGGHRKGTGRGQPCDMTWGRRPI